MKWILLFLVFSNGEMKESEVMVYYSPQECYTAAMNLTDSSSPRNEMFYCQEVQTI